MIIKRDLKIEKLDDEKKFLIKVYIEDKLTPEEVVKRLEEVNKVLEQVNKDIDGIPQIVQARSTQLNEQKRMAQEELDIFNSVEGQAKLWKTINEKVEERSPQ